MCCWKRDETVRTLPFQIFVEIISKFKIQVQERVQSAKSVTLYGHFLFFVVFYSRKSSCVQYFRSSPVRNYHWRQIRYNPYLLIKVLNGYVACNYDHLCGLVVRVYDYRYRGLGFDSRRYQIFWVVVGLERGPLSFVRSIEELLE